MYCSECGKPVQGKFCSNCGTPAAASLGATATATLPEIGAAPIDWETEHRYESLIQLPHVRSAIERHAAMAKKGMTSEEFTRLGSKLMLHGAPIDKLVPLVQPLYAKWGIGTGKERAEEIDAPIGRAMLRMLCSLARHGQALRGVQQGTDGCVFEAILPSDFRSFEGDLLVTVRRAPSTVKFKTQVTAATKIRGQMFDWGKSRKCLDDLYADLRLDPG